MGCVGDTPAVALRGCHFRKQVGRLRVSAGGSGVPRGSVDTGVVYAPPSLGIFLWAKISVQRLRAGLAWVRSFRCELSARARPPAALLLSPHHSIIDGVSRADSWNGVGRADAGDAGDRQGMEFGVCGNEVVGTCRCGESKMQRIRWLDAF